MKIHELCQEITGKVNFDLRFRYHVPILPGCYALANIHDDVLYIGQTTNLRRRMEDHRNDFRMNQRTHLGISSWFYYWNTPINDLRSVESQLFVKYKFVHGEWPPLNRTGP